jgi:hypothetical protein
MPRSAGNPKAGLALGGPPGRRPGGLAIPAFRGVKASGLDRLVLSHIHGDTPAQ